MEYPAPEDPAVRGGRHGPRRPAGVAPDRRDRPRPAHRGVVEAAAADVGVPGRAVPERDAGVGQVLHQLHVHGAQRRSPGGRDLEPAPRGLQPARRWTARTRPACCPPCPRCSACRWPPSCTTSARSSARRRASTGCGGGRGRASRGGPREHGRPAWPSSCAPSPSGTSRSSRRWPISSHPPTSTRCSGASPAAPPTRCTRRSSCSRSSATAGCRCCATRA